MEYHLQNADGIARVESRLSFMDKNIKLLLKEGTKFKVMKWDSRSSGQQ